MITSGVIKALGVFFGIVLFFAAWIGFAQSDYVQNSVLEEATVKSFTFIKGVCTLMVETETGSVKALVHHNCFSFKPGDKVLVGVTGDITKQ